MLASLGDDAAQGLASAEGPPGKAHLPADALEHTQPYLELLRCLLLSPTCQLSASAPTACCLKPGQDAGIFCSVQTLAQAHAALMLAWVGMHLDGHVKVAMLL